MYQCLCFRETRAHFEVEASSLFQEGWNNTQENLCNVKTHLLYPGLNDCAIHTGLHFISAKSLFYTFATSLESKFASSQAGKDEFTSHLFILFNQLSANSSSRKSAPPSEVLNGCYSFHLGPLGSQCCKIHHRILWTSNKCSRNDYSCVASSVYAIVYNLSSVMSQTLSYHDLLFLLFSKICQ